MWENSPWHPFVLPHPTKYSMVVAQFVCAKYSMECWRKKWSLCALDTSPCSQLSRILPFPISSPCAGWGSSFGLGWPRWGWEMSFKCFDCLLPWAWEHHRCNSRCFWLCRRERCHFSPAFLCWDTEPAWIRGWRGLDAPAALFPLVKMDSWSFADESDMAQLLSGGNENEMQWDFMLIFMFLLKKYVLM